jgi:hypothetical protein
MKSSIKEWILKSQNDLKLCSHELSNSEPVTEAREAYEKAEFTFDFTLNKINNIIKKDI